MCLTQLCTMCRSMNCPFVPDYLSRMLAEGTKLWETKTEQESHSRAKLRQVYCLLKTSEFPKLKVPQLQHKPTAGSPWSASLPTLKRLRLGVNLQELGSQGLMYHRKGLCLRLRSLLPSASIHPIVAG